MSIGKNIKLIRKKRNKTQEELAKEMNISRSYLSDLENDRRNPSTETLKSLSEKLGASLLYILEGKPTFSDHELVLTVGENIPLDKASELFTNDIDNRVYSQLIDFDLNSVQPNQRLFLHFMFNYLAASNDLEDSENLKEINSSLGSIFRSLEFLFSDSEREQYKRDFGSILFELQSNMKSLFFNSAKIVETKSTLSLDETISESFITSLDKAELNNFIKTNK